jgi:hypothetical protein
MTKIFVWTTRSNLQIKLPFTIKAQFLHILAYEIMREMCSKRMKVVWQTLLTCNLRLEYNLGNGGFMLKRLAPFLPVLLAIACAPDLSDPNIQSAVLSSLTATMWTPVPPSLTPTPEPNTSKIVEILNNIMVGTDPLLETVDAKFSVVDAQILLNESTKEATTIRISVDCEWIYSDSCTPEATFVKLIRAFSVNEKIIQHISDQVPATVHTLEVLTLDRMNASGLIAITWIDLVDYSYGRINGNQLGSRIIRQAATP